MSSSSSFENEVFRWINHWKRQSASDESISVSSLLANSADNIFFPNVRQLLKILVFLPMGSTDAYTRTIKLNERIFWWPIDISHPPFKNPGFAPAKRFLSQRRMPYQKGSLWIHSPNSVNTIKTC